MGEQPPWGRTKLVIALDPNQGNGHTSYTQDVHPATGQITLYAHKGSPLWLWPFRSEGTGTHAACGVIFITEGSHRFETSTCARLHEGCGPSNGVLRPDRTWSASTRPHLPSPQQLPRGPA